MSVGSLQWPNGTLCLVGSDPWQSGDWPNEWPNGPFDAVRSGRSAHASDPKNPPICRDFGRWARRVSNLRPLACEASALPLSYAP
jgi:hypothetical protein